MSFASPAFLWFFLPAVLFAHWVTPHHWRNAVLAVGSLLFYTVGGKEFIFLLGALMAVNYAGAIAIHAAEPRSRRAKAILGATVAGDLAALAVWKYAGFASATLDSIDKAMGGDGSRVVHLALPIGISFYTFHHISYVVDVFRGIRPPIRHPLTFVTYIAMFPQLIAGPIVRYHVIADQLVRQKHDRLADFVAGFPRFMWGLTKKVVVADSLAPVADASFAVHDPTFATAWIGALAYTGQIYFDFSGYSDMAIGLGRMFGLRLPENFRRPYSAVSVTDFWRRWHMTLSAWFREYLYIPLGGNRHGTTATYRNLVVVFLLTGLWHGAAWTFLLWGAYHGAWLVMERVSGLAHSDAMPNLRRGVTFLAVIVGWVLFRADTLGQFGGMLRAMVSPGHFGEPLAGIHPDVALTLNRFAIAMLLVVIVSAFLPGGFVFGRTIDGEDHVPVQRARMARFTAYALTPYAAVVVVAGTFSPFLYFRF